MADVMKKNWPIWLTFGVFLALGLGAMAWMTRTVLELDGSQARAVAEQARAAAALEQATQNAQVEENVRLALWRMDYALAPVLSQETARPYFEYSSLFPAERAYTRMFTELKSGDVLVPSPLLGAKAGFVLLYFQIDPSDNITSPQVPSEQLKKVAQGRYATAEQLQEAQRRLDRLKGYLTGERAVFNSLPAPKEAQEWTSNRLRLNANGTVSNAGTIHAGPQQSTSTGQNWNVSPNAPAQQAANPAAQQQMNNANSGQQGVQYDAEQQAMLQARRGQAEYNFKINSRDNNDILIGNNAYQSGAATPANVISSSVMHPLWLGDDTLVLARRVAINGQQYIQGCELDWPAVRRWLLETTADVVSGAELQPVRVVSDDKQPHMLAAIPARLVLTGGPGKVESWFTTPARSALSPLHVTLVIAWAGVILASAAVAVLLRGVVALSQRRAGFVAAVTHELRTPLTSLRMYTEMLAEGMVSDPQKQATYHRTMRAEADRLGHLVENVLLYSRLERSSRDARLETARVSELLGRLMPRLSDRATQAGMTLQTEIPQCAAEASIRANLLSVEQILFNLVDNACKYAGAGSIEFSAACVDGHVELRVRDRGPGLSQEAKARLFEPFSKSVHEAANSAPGLGLGLALSKRLARNMGADLRLESASGEGARFVLRVPREQRG